MDDSGCCCVPPVAVEAASDLAALTEAAVRCACGRDPLPLSASGGDVVADAGADDEAVEFLLPISKRRPSATR